MNIAIVDYGMGNIHSIIKAVRRYAPGAEYSGDPDRIARADALVLPGDGAFGAAMAGLAGGREQALRAAVAAGRPLLGICIGFQVLFENSDETFGEGEPDASIPGLGLLKGHIRHFDFGDKKLTIPHMGWNRLIPGQDVLKPGGAMDGTTPREPLNGAASGPDYFSEYMYFVHSCRAVDVPEETIVARCEYGGEKFPAVVRRDNLLATQFHPEKSGGAGLKLIEDWVENL